MLDRIAIESEQRASIRNVAVVALVCLPLWLVGVWLWILASEGLEAATTGIDSDGNLLGTFVFWFLINVLPWSVGAVVWEALAALVRRLLPRSWQRWAALLVAPSILFPYGLFGDLRFFASPVTASPLAITLAIYLLVLRVPALLPLFHSKALDAPDRRARIQGSGS